MEQMSDDGTTQSKVLTQSQSNMLARRWRRRNSPSEILQVIVLAVTSLAIPTQARAQGDALAKVKQTRVLAYGCDMEGGGPFAFIDPSDPKRVIGFEVEIMDRLADRLGAKANLSQGQWDQLLSFLSTRNIDCVVNGYELTPSRARDYLSSRPYYVFQMQLLVKKGSSIRSWQDLKKPKPGGGKWVVGVLGGTTTDTFAHATENNPDTISVRLYTGSTDAMLQVESGQLDATLQDLPAARFYATQYPKLELVGEPEGLGYYVIYVRKQDAALKAALDEGLEAMIADGSLKAILDKYGIWTDAQSGLDEWSDSRATAFLGDSKREQSRGWRLVWKYRDALIKSSAMTIALSVASMPLAMFAGLSIALGRLYGPKPLQWLLGGYVELIRGTPLMLQLFVLFYLANLPPWIAGIGGLAINYSAYEAEIYRAGLQAIPVGQMEAALALGMTRTQALRRVIVPQAVRIVIPPVTNDFIALFKDSSVCSVITLVELSKQYSILAMSSGGVLEFAIACASLYLLMSLPLSWLSRWSERRLGGQDAKGKGVLA
jgi:His/Glu/Gln/Arg/opine family amino acid ABC transporter permease subunit